MSDSSTNILVIMLMLVVVVGFYWNLSEINKLENQLGDLKMNQSTDKSLEKVSPGERATTTRTKGAQKTPEGAEVVPTAIIFSATSSPLLTPQTELTIALEEIVKTKDNRLSANIKVYTNKTDSYSALKPDNLFELVNLGGDNQKPLQVKGSFDSMPPQSAVTGQVIFQLNGDRNEVILRIQTKDGDKHYRFNFEGQTYEEAILG